METQSLAVALNSMALELKRRASKMTVRETDVLAGSMGEIAVELQGRGVIVVERTVKVGRGASYHIPIVSPPFPPGVKWVPEY